MCLSHRALCVTQWLIFVIVWGGRELNYWRLVFHQAEITAANTHTHTHICDFPPALVNLLHFLIILRREIAKEIGRRLCAVAYLLNINTRFRRKGCRMCMCLCVFTTPYRSSHFTPTTSILADYRAVISGHIQKGQSIGCTKRTKCSQKASQKHTF